MRPKSKVLVKMSILYIGHNYSGDAFHLHESHLHTDPAESLVNVEVHAISAQAAGRSKSTLSTEKAAGKSQRALRSRSMTMLLCEVDL